MYQHLSPDYQEKVIARWDSVLNAGGNIKSENARIATALVLENTQREFQKSSSGQLNEAIVGMGTQPGVATDPYNNATQGGNALGSTNDYGVCDSRIPSIVIPTLRRIFPELVAHDLVGVQPMGGPVGFAYALRHQYGANERGTPGGTAVQGQEIGYNTINNDFTGASGMVELDESGNFCQTVPGVGSAALSSEAWQCFAGNTGDGQGAGLNNSEWWAIGEDMPMAQFRLEKGVVEAKSRKLAAHWSLELGEDMMNMHGIDVDSEMVNVMSYEVQAEIDRQILGEMVKAAIVGGKVSEWDPVSADGRHQSERIGTLYTQTLIKSQEIAVATRRGPATFAVASPTVVALLERLGDFRQDAASVESSHASVGISKVGAMRNGGVGLYRDTFAAGDYMLLGYKGPTAYDSGIIYCPYIPLQLNRAVGQEDFTPRVGVRTRYGVLANLFGSANYYSFIKIKGITGTVQAADARVFTY